MTKNEIETILKVAGKASLHAAAAKFLGLPKNYEAAGGGAAVEAVVDEVLQWKTANAKTRENLESYKAAKG